MIIVGKSFVENSDDSKECSGNMLRGKIAKVSKSFFSEKSSQQINFPLNANKNINFTKK